MARYELNVAAKTNYERSEDGEDEISPQEASCAYARTEVEEDSGGGLTGSAVGQDRVQSHWRGATCTCPRARGPSQLSTKHSPSLIFQTCRH
jgi:hypothetical protein